MAIVGDFWRNVFKIDLIEQCVYYEEMLPMKKPSSKIEKKKKEKLKLFSNKTRSSGKCVVRVYLSCVCVSACLTHPSWRNPIQPQRNRKAKTTNCISNQNIRWQKKFAFKKRFWTFKSSRWISKIGKCTVLPTWHRCCPTPPIFPPRLSFPILIRFINQQNN